MLYEKIALVVLFLAVLFAVQLFLYKRYKSKPKSDQFLNGLRVHSRLTLSKTSQLNIVSAGSDTFLIVSSRNAPATVMTLNSLNSTDNSGRQINEV